ncbi:MAG: hypothetical protein ABIK68_12380 [bacterium]
MSEISKITSLKDLALMVCSRLKEDEIDAVLTGGAVVSIYTENEYESFDLGFISHSPISDISDSLSKLGFKRTKGRYYAHPNTDFFIEFPSPPVAVGNKPLKEFREIKTENGYLKLLTPTQCIMDRLAAFYHWNDQQSLDQAVAVTKSHQMNFEEVEEWSMAEGMVEKYEMFKKIVATEIGKFGK